MTVFDTFDRPIVATCSMEDGLTKVSSAMEAGYKGAGLHSGTRFGKTTLANFIVSYRDWIQTKYTAKVGILGELKPGEGPFCDWLISQLGLTRFATQIVEQKYERIVNQICMQMQTANAALFMFVMDDANLLSPDTFQCWVRIDNMLEARGRQFFLLSLFQDNHTSAQREAVHELVVTPQVRSRFLNRYHRLHGIRGEDDIATYLRRYENDVEWAPGAAVSLPVKLNAALYDSGFTMAKYSDLIWKEGQAACSAGPRGQVSDWPLKPFSLIVHHLTTRALCRPGFTQLTKEDIASAVLFSDLALYDSESGKVSFTDEAS